MVSKIRLPEEDSLEILRGIISERQKYKVFYNRITNDLINQAEMFIEHHGNPLGLIPLDMNNYTDSEEEARKRKKSLIGLYTPKCEKLPFDQLEMMRKHNGLVVCPSCGEPGRPRTLDHYLPKDIFPELSVLLLNLTPMCDWCQGEKLTDYVTEDGQKRYIHPYFDDVDRPLFSITFAPPFSTPSIDIAVKEEIPDDLSLLVESHLEGVDFLTRFKEYFKTRYISVLRRAHNCRQRPEEKNFRDTLALFLEMEQEKSINSWDAVLYRSILENGELMEYLENSPLPGNL
ncbi:HNH endonuclease [Pseudoalteromonas sp. B62]|uniref:HNH endonuclease n=1 Tax=Pseudoalteromonas sp. B62 TaxID=630483 RepID=UPI00301DD5CC